MRKLIFLLAGVLVLSRSGAQGFVIDHRSVDLFDHIPDSFLEAARNTRMMYSDRSVGANINEYLNYFTAESWARTPAAARRDYSDSLWNTKLYTQADRDAGRVPARILFDPDPVRYDRSKWTFVGKTGSWTELTQDFVQVLGPVWLDSADVLSYQFSYLNVLDNDDIADPQRGFFADQANRYDVYDLQRFIDAHPGKKFFFWTSSLARGIGTRVSTDFNQQMREYCRKTGQVLFDMADIISHTDQGRPCYDNRDGIPYRTENYPDDGQNYPAICQDYTSEVDGGHLGSVSGGGIRVVKALWVLMARLAGWDGILSSTRELSEDDFRIVPNPARGFAEIRIPVRGPQESSVIRVHSLNGEDLTGLVQLVPMGEGSYSMDVNGLVPGVYLVSCMNRTGLCRSRLVVH